MATGLFGDQLWKRLENNPETAALLKEPSFQTILSELRSDPSALSKHIADPRVLKLFTILSKQSNTAPTDSPDVVVEDANANAGVERNAKAKGSSDAKMPDAPPEKPANYESLDNKGKSAFQKFRGTAAYKSRDFPIALEAYTTALELDPDNMSLLTNRAAAKLESGDIEGAIADCKQALEDNSARSLRTDFKIIARAYARMGNAYLKKEDYDGAIRAFEKSLLEYSDGKVTLALRETQRLQKKMVEDAYFDADLSQKVRKEGNELFLAGKFPESIEKYSEAIKRNPKDAVPYSNRAAAYMKLGEFPMALKDCDRCLKIDPNFIKAYIRKGNVHFFMKEYYKCLKIYEEGLKIAPQNKELRQGLMKTNMKIQEMQSSGEVDQQQMEQAMKDPEIQQILQDPQMNTLLKQMQEDPRLAAKAMQDPDIAGKVHKLMASGFLRVG